MSDLNSTESNLKAALAAITTQKLSVLQAAEKYGIASNLLHHELLTFDKSMLTTTIEDGGYDKKPNGKVSTNSEEFDSHLSSDRETNNFKNIEVFDEKNENELITYILELCDHFDGIRKQHIQQIAFEYAEINHLEHQFNREKRETDSKWCSEFLDRHPELKTCIEQNETVASNSLNDDEILNKFTFDCLNRKAKDPKTKFDIPEHSKISVKRELKKTFDHCDDANSCADKMNLIQNESDLSLEMETEVNVSNPENKFNKPTKSEVTKVREKSTTHVISDQKPETKGRIEICGEINANERDSIDREDEFYDADVNVPEKRNIPPDTECNSLKLIDYDSEDEFVDVSEIPEQNTNKISERTKETELELENEEQMLSYESDNRNEIEASSIDSDFEKNPLTPEFELEIEEADCSDKIKKNNTKLTKDIPNVSTKNENVETETESDQPENDETPQSKTRTDSDDENIANTLALQSIESSVQNVEIETYKTEDKECSPQETNSMSLTNEKEMAPPSAKESNDDLYPIIQESDSEKNITCTEDKNKAPCIKGSIESSMKDDVAETNEYENDEHPSPKTQPSNSASENEIAPPQVKESNDNVNLVVQESDSETTRVETDIQDSNNTENTANLSATLPTENDQNVNVETEANESAYNENLLQESPSSNADNDKNAIQSLVAGTEKNADSSNPPVGSEIDLEYNKIQASEKATSNLPSEIGKKCDVKSSENADPAELNSKISDHLITNAETSAPLSDKVKTPSKNSKTPKRKNHSESENASSSCKRSSKPRSKRSKDKNVKKPRKKKYLYKLKSFTGSVLYFTSPISVTFIKPVITLTRIDEKDYVNSTTKDDEPNANKELPQDVDEQSDSLESTPYTPNTSQQSTIETEIETSCSRRMQTRKKQMKFLPDGTLVRPGQSNDELYSPPSPKRRKRPTRNDSKISNNQESVEENGESKTEVRKRKPLKIKDPYIQTTTSIAVSRKPQKIFDYDSYYREKSNVKGMLVIPPSSKTQKVALSRMKSVSRSANMGQLKVNPAELLSCLLGIPITQDQICSVRFKPRVKSQKPDNQINIASNNEAMKPIIKQQIQLLQNTSLISNTDGVKKELNLPDQLAMKGSNKHNENSFSEIEM